MQTTLGRSGWAYELRRLILLLAVGGTFALSIAYSNFETFDPMVNDATVFTDSSLYINEYYGINTDRAVDYRFATPYLARLMPDLPESFLSSMRAVSPTSNLVFKFAVVNVFFLLCTCVVLYYLNRGFGLSDNLALVGALLFFSLTVVIRQGALPVTDTSYWFFLTLAVLAVQRQNLWLLFGATLIGVFAKEQVLWVILFILLAPFTKIRRLSMLGAVAPAVVAYWAVVLAVAPSSNNYLLSGSFMAVIPRAITRLFSLNGAFQLWMAFGFLWLFCIYALTRSGTPTILARWVWFIPAVLVATRLLGIGGVQRHMAVSFVVVIPLAVIGMSKWLSLDQPQVVQRVHGEATQ